MQRNPDVGAFVWPVQALGLGDGGWWYPQAVGSVLQRRRQKTKRFACMRACSVHNMSTNHSPIAAPLSPDGSHTFWDLWLFLLTSNPCCELASDETHRRWHWNRPQASEKWSHLCNSKDVFFSAVGCLTSDEIRWDCGGFCCPPKGICALRIASQPNPRYFPSSNLCR